MHLKRIIDIFLSLIILVLISPLLLITSILIKLSSKGPVLFVQKRVGKDQREFLLYKFRSMRVDKVAESNFDFKKDAQRVTPVGRFTRRTKIDELPQLINILKGDMSFIGPRPTIMKQVNNYTPSQMKRLTVRPGLTGLAQVNGNIHLPWERRIEYDIYYIENYSLALEFKIFLKTILVVIFGEKRFLVEEDRKEA